MNTSAVLAALLQYGPTVLPLMAQLTTWIKNGKQDITAEDINLLISYGQKKADDYLVAIGLDPSTGLPKAK
jgi:hypothetical protein